jgi:hypothetical protein
LKELTVPHNLERLLKIIAYPFLSQLAPENASLYLDIVSQLSTPNDAHFYKIAFESLQVRIAEETLMKNLADYTDNIEEI